MATCVRSERVDDWSLHCTERSTFMSEEKREEAFGDREVVREDITEDAASWSPGSRIREAVRRRDICV